jgi:hypothetical protein
MFSIICFLCVSVFVKLMFANQQRFISIVFVESHSRCPWNTILPSSSSPPPSKEIMSYGWLHAAATAAAAAKANQPSSPVRLFVRSFARSPAHGSLVKNGQRMHGLLLKAFILRRLWTEQKAAQY